MMVPMQTAYANFPQPPAQHFQPQSPVYASQVLHSTMMDPMVRIFILMPFIGHKYEISVIVLCWFLIANAINILYMSFLCNCSCVSNNNSNQHQTLYHHCLSVMVIRLHYIPTNQLYPKRHLLLVSPMLVV